ncbi:MAG: FliM/FliN family flagellar motor switch protein [Candidatus Eremiobacteraeota bacterium]|nr:FliM/FliN family flagellar motor switch protein [Candidatus Eremiobacteraeota bacterium]
MTQTTALTVAALSGVEVTVTALLGRARVRIADVLAYEPGSLVGLDSKADSAVELLVNGVAVASGDIVVTDDGTLAIEIQSIATREEEPA